MAMPRQRSDSGGSRHPSVVGFAAQPAYTVALKSSADAAAATNDDGSRTNHSHSHSGGDQRPRRSQPSQHESLAHALLPDLPLLMHGSGDVLPEHVHPHSVATLARLIEGYVAALVGAAMDAHDVFTDGEVVGGGACLGVPPYRLAAGGGDGDDDGGGGGDGGDGTTARRRSKKRRKVDYWDVPLPPPVPDGGGGDSASGDSEISSDDSDDDVPLGGLRRLSSSASVASASAAEMSSSLAGFAPVDLHANERTRSHYVAAPTAMDARSFIFPICHDAVLYQRVKEVQASRRSIGRDLVDPVVMDAMKEEGATIGRWGPADMWDAVLGGRAGNYEGDGYAAAGASANKKKGGDKTSDKAKAKGAEKTKAISEEKKGEGGDGTNLVSAGLVDPDVDPSWPGLNALARGKLW